MIEANCSFELDIHPDHDIEISGNLKITKRSAGVIEVALKVEDKFITFNISSNDYVKLRVLESSKEFLDVGLAF